MQRTKTLARCGLLTAIALTIFLVEARLPELIPIPGVKLGLSNIVTVYAAFCLGPRQAVGILTARILLGSALSGQMMSLVYSACRRRAVHCRHAAAAADPEAQSNLGGRLPGRAVSQSGADGGGAADHRHRAAAGVSAGSDSIGYAGRSVYRSGRANAHQSMEKRLIFCLFSLTSPIFHARIGRPH